MTEDTGKTGPARSLALGIDAYGLGIDPVTRVLETSGGVMRTAQSRRLFAAVLTGSVALHVFALFTLNLLERAPPIRPDTALEIPVELVSDPAAGAVGKGKGPQTEAKELPKADGPAGERGSGARSAAKPSEQAAKPETQRAAAKPPQPTQAEKQASAKPASQVKQSPPPEPQTTEPKQAATQPAPSKPAAAQAEPPKPAARTEPPKSVAQEMPPQKPAAPAPQPLAPEAQPPKPSPPPQPAAQAAQPATAPPASAVPTMATLQMQATHPAAVTSPLMMDDDPLLAVAVPKPSEEGDEAMSYKTVVFGMLELAKQFPADARARGAHGAATVYFELDDAGGVKTVKLLKSSGDAELDVESLALVERAAPFPKPPRGAQKVFAAVIEYDPDQR